VIDDAPPPRIARDGLLNTLRHRVLRRRPSARAADTLPPAAPRSGFRNRESALVGAVVVLLIVARSAVFVFWSQADFDADQAVIGLMAKHLAERVAFPLFLYGHNYILAVEAWLAAPIFLIAGPSVTALKFPLLLINLAVALLLVRLLNREAGLRPALGLVASLFFVTAPPGTAAKLLEASGVNLEPFLYVLLLWLTRRRPVWFGLIAGIGFLQREFTIYGVLAIAVVELAHGTLLTRAGRRGAFAAARTAAEVWLVVQWLKLSASAAGPGTSWADLATPSNNVLEMFGRLCISPRTMATGVARMATVQWPALFGLSRHRLFEFGIESVGVQGLPGLGLVLGGAMAFAAIRIATHLWRERRWAPEYDFCAYLILVGAFSAGVYALGRCAVIVLPTMRYDLLSVMGAVGLGAWFLVVEPRRGFRRAWVTAVLAWALVAMVAHGRLWSEYLGHPPVGAKALIVRYLDAKGIKYARSDYWIAYDVTFLTNERVIVASNDFVRILRYQRIVAEHRAESVIISRKRCDAGEQVFAGVWFCPP
jgi:hypothetical protein